MLKCFVSIRLVPRTEDRPSEGAADDGSATKETRLQSSMFSGGALAVVLVADDDPRDVFVSVVARRYQQHPRHIHIRNLRPNGRDGAGLTGLLVEDAVGFAVVRVNCANQAIL